MSCQKIVVYLRSQFHAEGCLCKSCRVKSVLDVAMLHRSTQPLHHSIRCLSVGVADILKRRLLTLCSDALKLRNFHICIQDLATVDVLRDIDYPSCAYLVRLLRICVCAHAYLNYVAREYIYIRRGLRVVGLIQRAMRRPQVVERQQSDSTLFLYA